MTEKVDSSHDKNKYLLGILTGFLLTLLVLKLVPELLTKSQTSKIFIPFLSQKPTPTPDAKSQQEEITKAIFPDKLDLGVSYGQTIVNMVKGGAIDKEKLLALYEARGGLKSDEKQLLEAASDTPIIVTQQNANLVLNLLWPLGIANQTKVLSEGPMGTEYKKDVGNFASTGGWTLGKIDGGKLFNSLPIIPLTPDQETKVKEIAQNIYRPCCGNSTYFPDCNHGAAMLGFIELAVAQGMSEEEIYKKALVLSSYWFPSTYADLYVYFSKKKNTPWNKVEAKVVLGATYSGGAGYGKIAKQLQDEGLLPKVEGGGGCGV